MNRKLVRAILASSNIELTEAEDGEAAVASCTRRPFDVILMDLKMPVMDGRQAAMQIRSSNGPNSSTPILAFSAEPDPRLEASIFDAVLTKPIRTGDLIEAIARTTGYG